MNKYFKVGALVMLGATLSACKTTETDNAPELSVESVPEAVDVGESVSNVKLGPGLQRLADLAIADMSTRFAIDKEKINVVDAEFVTWRDSAAGCPQPGMSYMQVLTSGSRIVLKAAGKLYHYHSGGNRPPAYCSRPSKEKPLPYQHGDT